ncbi:MAG: hypothetical protein A2010_07535 [Nitrospirae bacterium GWD2_57_9]|nr:MAG: hypothetical protein A2010_07535 [Nitrospirae bacterium GWD2_57_9]
MLKYKFLLIILVVFVPLTVFSFHHYLIMVDDEKEIIKARNLDTAIDTARELDEIIDKTLGVLHALALHPSVKALNSDQCDRLFAQLLPSYPDHLNILLADMDGFNRGTGVSTPDVRRINYQDKEWFVKAGGNRSVVHDLHISKLFQMPAAMIAIPIFNDNTKQIGVIGMPLNLRKISGRIGAGHSLRKKPQCTVIDAKGNVLMNSTNAETIGSNIVDKPIIQHILKSVFGNSEETDAQGMEMLYGFASLKKSGWKIIVSNSATEAYSDAKKMSTPYLIALTIVSLIVLGLSLLLISRLNKKLAAVTRGLEEIEQGNMSFQLAELSRGDEMADVARSFNRMAEKRRIAEQKARDAELFLSSVLDGIGEGVVVIDRDYKIISANKGYCSQVRLGTGDVIAKHCYEISHRISEPCFEKEDGCECAVKLCFDTGRHHRSIHTHFASDGQYVHVETNAYPLKDSSGTVTAVIETLMDVTKKLTVEQELKKVTERYRELYYEAPDMMHSISNTGTIIVCNDTEARFLGYDLHEIVGLPATEIVDPDSRHAYEKKLELLKTTGFYEGELIYVARDGKKIPVFIKAKAVYDEAGRFVISDEIARDITEKKSLEAQLLHSQKMEAVGTLAGGVAHDFNNILTAIIGYGHLALMKTAHDDQIKNFLKEILASADRAAHLTKSLLAFSRKQVMSKAPINVNNSIEGVKKLLERVIGENIELKISLSPDDIIVLADSGQIEQVLMNLATNAKDAMPNGGHISISTEVVYLDEQYIMQNGYGTEGFYALISISDTGSGIDAATRTRIFDPFFTTKEVGKGTGLGLSIAYGIMKQHNGYINCYSEVGHGTIFKLYLPILTSVSESRQKTTRELPAYPRGTETILLAEDDAGVRNFFSRVLQEHGYCVIASADGDDAVRKFSENKDRIHLAVLDVVMPKLNGKEVYHEIRKSRPDLKTLFVSGYTGDIIGGSDDGETDNFLSKPVGPGALLKKIRQLLDGTVR